MRAAFVYRIGPWRWRVEYRCDEGMGTEEFMCGWRALIWRRVKAKLHPRTDAPEMVVR